MKGSRFGLRYAVLLITLLTASLLSWFEETRDIRETDLALGDLATAITDSVRADLVARRTTRIGRLAERLRGQAHLKNSDNPPRSDNAPGPVGAEVRPASGSTGGIDALVICSLGRGSLDQLYWLREKSFGFPTQRHFERICPEVAMEPVRAVALTRARLDGHSFAIHVQELDVNNKGGPRYLVLAKDLNPIIQTWPGRFGRAALLMLLINSLLALIVHTQARTQARVWLLRQLDNLRSPLARARASARTRAFSDGSTSGTAVSPLVKSLGTRRLVVVSNREPYIHQRSREGTLRVTRPASGLVSALEPILRECGGLWVAHGSGNADAEVIDARSEVAVPPDKPRYRLRRLWLTPEEEQGYYYGFANEGIWPLCHLAHTRPIFRLPDWVRYRAVNRRFAETLQEESASDESLIVIQDYHLALLPRLVRELPRPATNRPPRIGLFWHIPWPNPEAFGICPWGRELLDGMLGADVIGFHTQYHCNNFLETCNRYLEARIDWERFSVTCRDRETLVRAFPIGIDTPVVNRINDSERERLKEELGITAPFVAVGVDRIDYTKGLIERVEGVERFLEKFPKYQGKFSLVQVGSPSRSSIESYKDLARRLGEAVERVNARFGRGEPGSADNYRPVIFLPEHHDWKQIERIYQIGDLCLVTSLHDGMNLVAKEYVWCQAPERGALILSRFTGASRELTEALIVNPYSIEELADAIEQGLEMPAAEKVARMSAMREKIHRFNALHWATDLISTLIKANPGMPVTAKLPPGLPMSSQSGASRRTVVVNEAHGLPTRIPSPGEMPQNAPDGVATSNPFSAPGSRSRIRP